jgi:hypothetical protein
MRQLPDCSIIMLKWIAQVVKNPEKDAAVGSKQAGFRFKLG